MTGFFSVNAILNLAYQFSEAVGHMVNELADRPASLAIRGVQVRVGEAADE